MNINTWLVICNASQANVYEVSKVNYKLIDLLMHPQSRLKPQELISDRSGNFQSSQAMPGQFSPANNPQEEEHKVFAKEIVDYLEKHRQQNNYDRILLCAEPGFYGRLNKVIASPLEQIITKVVQKDYVPLPKPKLDNMIKKLIEEHY